nr:hypothetical protein [Sphingobium bisphenolivorans]
MVSAGALDVDGPITVEISAAGADAVSPTLPG